MSDPLQIVIAGRGVRVQVPLSYLGGPDSISPEFGADRLGRLQTDAEGNWQLIVEPGVTHRTEPSPPVITPLRRYRLVEGQDCSAELGGHSFDIRWGEYGLEPAVQEPAQHRPSARKDPAHHGFCTSCGKPRLSGAAFCTECGAALDPLAPASPRPTPHAEPVTIRQPATPPKATPDPPRKRPLASSGGAATTPASPGPGGGYAPAGYLSSGNSSAHQLQAETFSVGEAFRYGWKKFTENVGPILIVTLVYLVASLVLFFVVPLVLSPVLNAVLPTSTESWTTSEYVVQDSGSNLLFALIMFLWLGLFAVWGYLLQAVTTRGGLALAEGRPLSLGSLFSLDKMGRIVVAGTIMTVLVVLGGLVFILPGLIVAFFGNYFAYFILDQNSGVWESITSSFRFVQQNLGNVALLQILSGLAVMAGMFVCYVGLIVAIPVVVLANTYAYKVLRGEPVAA